MRSWRDEDRAPFAALCADPKVMATLGPVMSRAEADVVVDRAIAREQEHGHTSWALERLADRTLIGWCGVIRGHTGPVADKAELGWRLASDYWGQGYAIEAARASLVWTFANLPDDAAWAITSRGNVRSRSVMERLGLRYRPECDFAHPRIADGDPLQPHVAYCLERSV